MDALTAVTESLKNLTARKQRVLTISKATLAAIKLAKADGDNIKVVVQDDPDQIVTTITEEGITSIAADPGDSGMAYNLDDVQANFKLLVDRLGQHTNKLGKALEAGIKNEKLATYAKGALAKAMSARDKMTQIHNAFGISKDDAGDMEDHQVRWLVSDMMADLQRLATLEELLDGPTVLSGAGAGNVGMAKSATGSKTRPSPIGWPSDMASAKYDETEKVLKVDDLEWGEDLALAPAPASD